uniref:Uncharacterized protein n=1 Tax=uncultured Alphaproteobacteria bacterium TaxID=91750 RepID=A0A6M4NMX0_9PROT|nr:hypothetical protein PlAlph_2610 [uncultured Alphaproteobacteria bacterium]
MSDVLDKFVNLFKWPAAVLALWTVPAFFQSLDYFGFRNIYFIALFGGFFMYFIAQVSMDSGAKTSMQIIAHELTHSFFAVLTFHKVKHIRVAEDNSGGSMGFVGEGNWLIIIAPYFFPLFCMVYMIGASIYLKFMPMTWVVSVLFGYFVGYHVDTVASQIHDKQTDLKEVGYPFCFMFLPGANFWVLGCLLAYNSRGWEGISVYQSLLWKLNLDNLAYLFNLIRNL